MRYSLAWIVCTASIAVASSAQAGPWVKGPGEAFLKTGLTYFSAEQGFNQGVATGLKYTAVTYNVYAEVGLPSDLQIVADIPFVTASNTSGGGVDYRNSSFGDARFELDYGILSEIPLTLGLEAKVPLYTNVSAQPALSQEYPRSVSKFPDPGDGNLDLTPKLMAGWSFHPIPAWATAEAGYRIRLGRFVDGVAWAAGVGYFVVKDHLALGLYGSGVISIASDSSQGAQTKEYAYAQAYLLLKGLTFAPELGLNISVGGIFQARNAARGADLSVGVSHAF